MSFTCPHMTRWSFMDLRHIPITPIRIRGITRGWGWRGARRDSRSVPGPAATGAFANGTTATSTKITSIQGAIETTLTAARAAAANGGIILRIAATRPTVIAERRTSSAEEARVALVALVA